MSPHPGGRNDRTLLRIPVHNAAEQWHYFKNSATRLEPARVDLSLKSVYRTNFENEC